MRMNTESKSTDMVKNGSSYQQSLRMIDLWFSIYSVSITIIRQFFHNLKYNVVLWCVCTIRHIDAHKRKVHTYNGRLECLCCVLLVSHRAYHKIDFYCGLSNEKHFAFAVDGILHSNIQIDHSPQIWIEMGKIMLLTSGGFCWPINHFDGKLTIFRRIIEKMQRVWFLLLIKLTQAKFVRKAIIFCFTRVKFSSNHQIHLNGNKMLVSGSDEWPTRNLLYENQASYMKCVYVHWPLSLLRAKMGRKDAGNTQNRQ